MILNIFAGIMFIIVVAAGIWCWRLENSGTETKDKKDSNDRKDLE